eukprot:GEMP01056945.1.p1 GENE.GEMP01056945.1~~GEMP01056945.1.p1  ORF type:complete len:216 (+),score=62.10 GEMP01056945.1:101-748(+)
MLSELGSHAEETVSFSAQERRELDNHCNLYSLIRTCEHVERGFVNGNLPSEIYERQCAELLAQFKTLQKALKHDHPDITQFIRQHNMDCPLAQERLLGTGVAATKLHQGMNRIDPANESLYVFEASQHLTTLMDALKLNMRSVDELAPPFKEMLSSFNKISSLPAALDGLEKITEWLYTLNKLAAADEISEPDARQFAMDLEMVYNAFHKWLREK